MKKFGWLLSAVALTAMLMMIASSPPADKEGQVAKKNAVVTAEEVTAQSAAAVLQKSAAENAEVCLKTADVEQYAARIANSPATRRPAFADLIVGNAVRTMKVAKKTAIRHPILA